MVIWGGSWEQLDGLLLGSKKIPIQGLHLCHCGVLTPVLVCVCVCWGGGGMRDVGHEVGS